MKTTKVYSFVAWWDGDERRCSEVAEYDSARDIPSPGKGMLHTYDSREEAEEERQKELEKNQ